MYEICLPIPLHRHHSILNKKSTTHAQLVHRCIPWTVFSYLNVRKLTSSFENRPVVGEVSLPLKTSVTDRMLKFLCRSKSTQATGSTGEAGWQKNVSYSATSSSYIFENGGMVISNKRYSVVSDFTAEGLEQPVITPPVVAIMQSNSATRVVLKPAITTNIISSASGRSSSASVTNNSFSQSKKSPTLANSASSAPSSRISGCKLSTVSNKEKLIRIKEGERVQRLRMHSEVRRHNRQQLQQQQQQSQLQKVKFIVKNLDQI